jgi:hypothetical protein
MSIPQALQRTRLIQALDGLLVALLLLLIVEKLLVKVVTAVLAGLRTNQPLGLTPVVLEQMVALL